MNFYTNLKIKDKLVLGFSTVVIMALAIGIFGYFQIYKLERAGSSLFEQGVKPLEYVGKIEAGFQRLRVNIREFISAQDENKHDYYLGRILTFRMEIDANVNNLEASLPDAESKKLFARLVQARSRYTPHFSRTIELSKLGRDDDAMKYMKSDVVYAAEHDEIEAIEDLQE